MNKNALKAATAAISAMLFLSVQTAQASTDKLRAEAYFNAISGGNAETISSFYADKAEFHWVGGPLAGIYTGKAQIRSLWKTFSQSAGDVDHKVLEISESKNGKISTVTARVNIIGPKQVPVKFIMMYEDGKIVSQIWQLDKPGISAKAEPSPEAEAKTASNGEAKSPAPNTDAEVLAEPLSSEETREVTASGPASAPAQLTTGGSAAGPALLAKKPREPKKNAYVARKIEKPQYEEYEEHDDDDDYGQDYGHWERRNRHFGFGYYGYRRFY